MMKPTTWVLYRWERAGRQVVFGGGEVCVQSKGVWQSHKELADKHPSQYRATWLAESADKAMLEKMRDLAKEK